MCVCARHLLNVELGENELSAWCKLHGDEFKGEKIPFGALVYFKLSGARVNDRDTSLTPRASHAYEIAPGVTWKRQYMA